MRTRQRAQIHRLWIVGLILVPLFGCTGLDRIGREIGLRNDGAIDGRVEIVRPGGPERDRDPQSGSAIGPMLVYLESDDASLATPSNPGTSPSEIRIGAGRQEPQLVVVPPNQPFHFRNLDPIFHEPFSLDAPNDFRVRVGGHESSGPIRLPQSGFVRAFCGLHPAETFALIVSPAQHVAAVRADGSFAIEDVRSGSYRIRAAGVDVESAALPIRVSRGETLKLHLRLSPRAAK